MGSWRRSGCRWKPLFRCVSAHASAWYPEMKGCPRIAGKSQTSVAATARPVSHPCQRPAVMVPINPARECSPSPPASPWSSRLSSPHADDYQDPLCFKCQTRQTGYGGKRTLLCEGPACERAAHLQCVSLRAVPHSAWFCCPGCQANAGAPSSRLMKVLLVRPECTCREL